VKKATSGDVALLHGSHRPLFAKAQFWLGFNVFRFGEYWYDQRDQLCIGYFCFLG
jgi:hypothetical protein